MVIPTDPCESCGDDPQYCGCEVKFFGPFGPDNPKPTRCEVCKSGALTVYDDGCYYCQSCKKGYRFVGMNRGSSHRMNPHPWQPLIDNGWNEVGRDDRQPELGEWVLVWGVGPSGRDRFGVGCLTSSLSMFPMPPYWKTWPHGIRVTHWMPAPFPPGRQGEVAPHLRKYNDSALLDWVGSAEERVQHVVYRMMEGYSIRQGFLKSVDLYKGE